MHVSRPAKCNVRYQTGCRVVATDSCEFLIYFMTWLSGTSRLQFSRLSTYDLQTLNYSGDERKPSRSYVQGVLLTLFTYYIISFQLPRNIVVCLTKGFV
jgi:hypothetical protein